MVQAYASGGPCTQKPGTGGAAYSDAHELLTGFHEDCKLFLQPVISGCPLWIMHQAQDTCMLIFMKALLEHGLQRDGHLQHLYVITQPHIAMPAAFTHPYMSNMQLLYTVWAPSLVTK